MAKYEIKNIRPGNKANASYKGQPDRSHILYAEVHCDGELEMNATLDRCVERVKERMQPSKGPFVGEFTEEVVGTLVSDPT